MVNRCRGGRRLRCRVRRRLRCRVRRRLQPLGRRQAEFHERITSRDPVTAGKAPGERSRAGVAPVLEQFEAGSLVETGGRVGVVDPQRQGGLAAERVIHPGVGGILLVVTARQEEKPPALPARRIVRCLERVAQLERQPSGPGMGQPQPGRMVPGVQIPVRSEQLEFGPIAERDGGSRVSPQERKRRRLQQKDGVVDRTGACQHLLFASRAQAEGRSQINPPRLLPRRRQRDNHRDQERLPSNSHSCPSSKCVEHFPAVRFLLSTSNRPSALDNLQRPVSFR